MIDKTTLKNKFGANENFCEKAIEPIKIGVQITEAARK